MKNKIKISLFAVLGLCILALTSTRVSAIVLGLEPASQNAVPGDPVSLDLVVSGLGAGGPDSLGDFDIDIFFDTSALSFTGYSLGAGLGDIGLFEAIDFSFGDLGGGMVNLAEVSLLLPFELDTLQAASFTLATLDFHVDVLAPGSQTPVDIYTVWAVGDGFGQALSVDGTNDAVVRNPAAEMPEPTTLSLIALGLVGVGLSKRSKK
jgi:hypothetical protein